MRDKLSCVKILAKNSVMPCLKTKEKWMEAAETRAGFEPCCDHLVSSCFWEKRRADLNLLHIWKEKLNLTTASLPDDCLRCDEE